MSQESQSKKRESGEMLTNDNYKDNMLMLLEGAAGSGWVEFVYDHHHDSWFMID